MNFIYCLPISPGTPNCMFQKNTKKVRGDIIKVICKCLLIKL